MSISRSTKSAHWQSNIDALHASGLSEREWCSKKGISYSSLRYWIRKLKESDQTYDSDDTVFASIPNDPLLSLYSGAPVTIRFASATIEISGSCHPQLLESLILIIKKYA